MFSRTLWGWIRPAVHSVLALDLRSLATFRIALGLILLFDLGVRVTDLGVFYTDRGVVPRTALSTTGFATIHVLNGSAWYQGSLFFVAALAALALAAGWHTRAATVASWALLLSLHGRNPHILSSADGLLRALLFWGMFLPLGARWSLDATRHVWSFHGIKPKQVASLATCALLMQVCLLYGCTVILKSGPTWRHEGSAVWYALQLDSFATSLGQELLNYPKLLTVLTYATLVVEAAGPILLLSPWFVGPIRIVLVCAFLFFHFGLASCMNLGLFSYVAAAAWLAFLPSCFWDALRCPERLRAVVGQWCEKATQSLPPTNAESPLGMIAQGTLAFCMIYVALWNVRTIYPNLSSTIFPRQGNSLGRTFGMGQDWGMFAPNPSKHDGWYVMLGQLENGTEIDLMKKAAPHWETPDLYSAELPNHRWAKFLINLSEDSMQDYRPHLARYLQQEWERHAERPRVKAVYIYYLLHRATPALEDRTVEKTLLHSSHFYDRDPTIIAQSGK